MNTLKFINWKKNQERKIKLSWGCEKYIFQDNNHFLRKKWNHMKAQTSKILLLASLDTENASFAWEKNVPRNSVPGKYWKRLLFFTRKEEKKQHRGTLSNISHNPIHDRFQIDSQSEGSGFLFSLAHLLLLHLRII